MIVNVGKVIIMVASARRSKESVVPAEDQLSSVNVIALSALLAKVTKLQMRHTCYEEVVNKISNLSAIKVVGHATYYLKLLSFQAMVPQSVSATPK